MEFSAGMKVGTNEGKRVVEVMEQRSQWRGGGEGDAGEKYGEY